MLLVQVLVALVAACGFVIGVYLVRSAAMLPEEHEDIGPMLTVGVLVMIACALTIGGAAEVLL